MSTSITGAGSSGQLQMNVVKGEQPKTLTLNDKAPATIGKKYLVPQGGGELIDVSDPAAMQKFYAKEPTVEDIAASLWKMENTAVHPGDQASLDRFAERLQSGNISFSPTAEELSAYIAKLRENGLGGTVNWDEFAGELNALRSVQYNNLEAGMDQLVSRYVAIADKLERNYSGSELSAQQAKLEEVYRAGVDALVKGYAGQLQENLGLSEADMRDIESSLNAIIRQKETQFQSAVSDTHKALGAYGADKVWLKDHDAFFAAELRKTAATDGSASGEAAFSLQDLTTAGLYGEMFKAQRAEAAASWDEVDAAMNLALADMKLETRIEKGLVSGKMAAILQTANKRNRAAVMDEADKRLARHESSRLPGTPEGAFAPFSRELYHGIYQTMMDAFHHSGDGAAAIRAGAAFGQNATAELHERNPEVQRWGISMEDYWKNFYKAPEQTSSNQQINKLLTGLGYYQKSNYSQYENFINSWTGFLSSIGAGNPLNILA